MTDEPPCTCTHDEDRHLHLSTSNRCTDCTCDGYEPVQRDGDRYVLTYAEHLRYDPERGTLDTLVDGEVRESLLVRQGLVEQVQRAVIIAELRRLGYTVTEP